MRLGRLTRYLFCGIFLFSACVPNRKIQYLQHNDVNKKDLPKDTVIRKYDMKIQDYRIQPLDVLYIRIESLTDENFDFFTRLYPLPQSGGANQQLINGFLVDNNGEIEFPVVGKVKFAGLTVFEAQNELEKVFSPYLSNAVARVRLLNFRFTVLGAVNAENEITSTNTRITFSEAIGLAGGLTDMADRRNVKVIRQVGGHSEVFYLDLLNEDLVSSSHYYVQQNDIIIVPPLRQRPIRAYWAQNISLFVSTVSVVILIASLLTK